MENEPSSVAAHFLPPVLSGHFLVHSFAVPGSCWDVFGLCMDYRWCVGWEVVLGIFWHTHSWESRVAFIDGCIFIFVCAREGKGLSKGAICCAAAVIEKGFSKARAQGAHIYSCLHACSISFTPPWIQPCGISGFSLSWGGTDYSTEAVWHCCCIRLTFPVSTTEWEAANPARCEGLYIGIT